MNDFIRARTDGQKQIRMAEIKASADALFNEMPYSDITLTTISTKLGWSRANLYKYVTTKEEIYLAICEEKMAAYFSSLNAAFPEDNKYSAQVVAEVWAGILNASQDYLHYVSILTSIIEKNVTVDRLAAFKKKYFDGAFAFSAKLSKMLSIPENSARSFFLDVLLYSSAGASSCEKNPLVQQALAKIKISTERKDFYDIMKNFILMEINWRTNQKSS